MNEIRLTRKIKPVVSNRLDRKFRTRRLDGNGATEIFAAPIGMTFFNRTNPNLSHFQHSDGPRVGALQISYQSREQPQSIEAVLKEPPPCR